MSNYLLTKENSKLLLTNIAEWFKYKERLGKLYVHLYKLNEKNEKAFKEGFLLSEKYNKWINSKEYKPLENYKLNLQDYGLLIYNSLIGKDEIIETLKDLKYQFFNI